MDTYIFSIRFIGKIGVVSIFIMMSIHIGAQQQVQYTQFLSNKLWLNPAYAGSHGHGTIQGIGRNQWIGVDGAPKTAALSYHRPSEKMRTGYGLGMTYDQIGPTTSYTISTSYAYVLWQTQEKRLSLGLQGAYTWWDLDFSQVETTEIGDDAFNINPVSLSWLNFGAGIFYQSSKSFVGFSVPRLLQKQYFDFSSQDLQAKFVQHWYLMGGHVFRLTEDIELNTGALVKYVKNTPLDLDVSTILIFNKSIWAGVNWRMGTNADAIGLESLDLILQYQVSDKLRLGLAYDYTLSQLQNLNNGTLELLVHWDMIRQYKNVQSIRYF